MSSDKPGKPAKDDEVCIPDDVAAALRALEAAWKSADGKSLDAAKTKKVLEALAPNDAALQKKLKDALDKAWRAHTGPGPRAGI
jgi:hypothetical protein